MLICKVVLSNVGRLDLVAASFCLFSNQHLMHYQPYPTRVTSRYNFPNHDVHKYKLATSNNLPPISNFKHSAKRISGYIACLSTHLWFVSINLAVYLVVWSIYLSLYSLSVSSFVHPSPFYGLSTDQSIVHISSRSLRFNFPLQTNLPDCHASVYLPTFSTNLSGIVTRFVCNQIQPCISFSNAVFHNRSIHLPTHRPIYHPSVPLFIFNVQKLNFYANVWCSLHAHDSCHLFICLPCGISSHQGRACLAYWLDGWPQPSWKRLCTCNWRWLRGQLPPVSHW